MTCKELRVTLNKFSISKRQLSTLLNYDFTYLSSLSSREQDSSSIPVHIETIVNLLYYLKINNIDYVSVLKDFSIKKQHSL